MKSILWCTALLSAVATIGAQNAPPPPPPPPNPPAPPTAAPPANPAWGTPSWNGVRFQVGHELPTPATPRPAHPADAYTGFLFPPELVMQHQRELGLQDAQREKLIKEMSAAQAQFTEAQWTLSAEQDKLTQLVKGTTIDEAAVVKQMDRILSLEQGLKRTQLLMMVRVKNVLTPEQQQILQRFHPMHGVTPTPARRGGGDHPHPPGGFLF
jgi:Spy/CpxP family protein refolding chaperone